MLQLTAAHQLYPSSFFRELDDLIAENLHYPGNALPSVILNPRMAFENEMEGVVRFESEEIPMFGVYLATDRFDYIVSESDLTLKGRLPDGLLERMRAYYMPHLEERDIMAFEQILDGLTLRSLSQAYLDLEDFFEPSDQVYVQDEWFESWLGFCELYFERLIDQRITFLSVDVVEWSDFQETEYWAGPYTDILDEFGQKGEVLTHQKLLSGIDEHSAVYAFFAPVRGGGFTCMN